MVPRRVKPRHQRRRSESVNHRSTSLVKIILRFHFSRPTSSSTLRYSQRTKRTLVLLLTSPLSLPEVDRLILQSAHSTSCNSVSWCQTAIFFLKWLSRRRSPYLLTWKITRRRLPTLCLARVPMIEFRVAPVVLRRQRSTDWSRN